MLASARQSGQSDEVIASLTAMLETARAAATAEPKSDLQEAKDLQMVVVDQTAILKRFQHNKGQAEKSLEVLRQTRQSHLDNQIKRVQEIEEQATRDKRFVNEQTDLLLADSNAAITAADAMVPGLPS